MTTSVLFYTAGLVEIVIAVALFKASEPYYPVGADGYKWVRFRRVLGKILLVAALMTVAIGVVSDVVSAHR
jgi:hypothetical protein